VIYEHPVEPPRADSAQAVREFTQRCTDVLEMHVRRHPELWLWMHRRWRDSGPSLEGVPGMFPAAERDETGS
jgi:KDO2-lipid IV(A) lauroyltransferase